ncbi:MAG: GNAT family N-acetyltransferase [Bacteroidia bacterium]|nr:GNAT family N-acetyltransferase [Bacteroidia bacterium]
MNIRFTTATLLNVDAIAALASDIWYEHYSSIITQEQIAYMLNLMYAPIKLIEQMQDGCVFTLVYNNDELIGYASTQQKNDTQLFIHKFYIHSKIRGNKVGERLLNAILANYTTINTVQLVVNRQNFTAVNFYFKQGFTIIDAFDNNIGGGFFMNDFKMQLTLSKQ